MMLLSDSKVLLVQEEENADWNDVVDKELERECDGIHHVPVVGVEITHKVCPLLFLD